MILIILDILDVDRSNLKMFFSNMSQWLIPHSGDLLFKARDAYATSCLGDLDDGC